VRQPPRARERWKLSIPFRTPPISIPEKPTLIVTTRRLSNRERWALDLQNMNNDQASREALDYRIGEEAAAGTFGLTEVLILSFTP